HPVRQPKDALFDDLQVSRLVVAHSHAPGSCVWMVQKKDRGTTESASFPQAASEWTVKWFQLCVTDP
ncbi:hypothetical protein, partial [Paracoccus sp. (in: a-proteobacteria)]|uniref:hypothetical protein n=1 Tax=Paracoccus sp. TaxID=267 RepID=UPI003A89D4A1